MSVINLEIYSTTLRKETNINILIPNNYNEETKILFLLHGQSNNQNAFLIGSKIGVYMNDLNYFVIMPDVARSFYTDMENGYKYFTYLTEELPLKIEQIFNIKLNNYKKYVCGFSMGGYGAFKWGLTKPNYFNGVGSISGALDLLAHEGVQDEFHEQEFKNIFGIDLENNDLIKLLDQKNDSLFIQCVGAEDFLYDMNISFKTKIMEKNFKNYEFYQSPGIHDWHFADENLLNILKRFNNEGN